MSKAPVEPNREHDRRRLLRGAATLAGLGLGGSLVLVARPALAAQAVSTLTLINADTDQPVAGLDPLSSGATLDLSTLPTRNLNIRANTTPATVGSVRFGLDGNSNYRIETAPPYALAGDASSNYAAWTPSVGSHSVTATPYTGAGGTGAAGTPITVSFTVQDGSTGSTSGGTSPPPPPATGVNTTLAFGGQYLGCPIYAASKAPNGYWDKHDYRFVAEYTGTVKSVRWENRTGTGYSIGNGGSIQLSIQTDSGGRPSGQKLGYTAVHPNAASLGNFPELPFTALATLTYGVTYHLVFEQLARSQGKVSVNDLHDWVAPPDGLSIFPLEKATLASIRYENSAWRVMPGYIPIYELVYADGVAKGQPWMGGGRDEQQIIGGGNVARQSFSMYDLPPVTVTGVYFAFFRDGSVGPVTIRLTDAANRTLSQTSIDGNQASVASEGDNAPVHWLYADIGPTTFATGGTYYAAFQAAAGARLWALPINNGYFYGFRNKCGIYVNRGAQYSTSGGASWTPWPKPGGYSTWLDLPIFLKTF